MIEPANSNEISTFWGDLCKDIALLVPHTLPNLAVLYGVAIPQMLSGICVTAECHVEDSATLYSAVHVK